MSLTSRVVLRALGLLVWVVCTAQAQVQAQVAPAARLELRFEPVERAQLALWVERDDGEFLATVRLTEAVSLRGIGNRPGASQMFATVSPCMVATAAWGTPLAHEVGVLRRLRDRYLQPHALGRALVSTYYALGPKVADAIREHPALRAAVRTVLTPLIALAHALD